MTDPPDQLVFARDLVLPDDGRRQHARAAAAGGEIRISRGVYADSKAVAELDARGRYLLLIRAVAETRLNRPVLSHWSAAAIHGLPVIGDWPHAVHISQPLTIGTRSSGNVVRHTVPLDESDVIEIDGMLVTTASRTIVDLAACVRTLSAVVAVDAALHVDRFDRAPPLTTIDQLWEVWERRLPFRGHARASQILAFGTTKADTPIESVSRVTMASIGCPAPVLQMSHFDDDGFIAESDFAWPDYESLGEADGDRKYLDAAYRSGKTVERIFLEEKIREDRLRALPRSMARWRWATALSPRLLRRALGKIGLPFSGARAW